MNSLPPSLRSGIFEYRKIGLQTGVENAGPHKLIQMLLDGAVAKVQLARGAMQRGEIARKGETVSWAMAIVDGLRSSLDLARGGEIAANLDALYDYMLRRLAQANLENDVTMLDEVVALLNEIREGWHAIR